MTFRRSFLFTFFIVSLSAATFVAGYLAREWRDASLTEFPVLKEAYNILIKNGLKQVSASPDLEYGMIRGMVAAYDDPYTVFVAPAQHELESNALQGSFGGIGVRLGRDPQSNWVLFPIPGSPAEAANIQEGDRLLGVDQLSVNADTPQDDIQSAIRGPVGKRVKITIGRPPNFSPIILQVKRAEIPLPSVTWHLALEDARVGVIEINLIAESTPKEILNAVKDLQERGAKDFILDLRNNPGGLLTAGVDVARLFLKDGIIIQQQYRGRDVETFRVDKPGPLEDLPLVVLINHGSASAAEIIAGSLKAHKRALLIGSPSFGKDTIQLVFDLKDGSSLHVTSAHWWIPDLKPSLGGVGLQPDIPVSPQSQEAGPDADIQAAINALLGSE